MTVILRQMLDMEMPEICELCGLGQRVPLVQSVSTCRVLPPTYCLSGVPARVKKGDNGEALQIP